jgi:hypothetical protein
MMRQRTRVTVPESDLSASLRAARGEGGPLCLDVVRRRFFLSEGESLLDPTARRPAAAAAAAHPRHTGIEGEKHAFSVSPPSVPLIVQPKGRERLTRSSEKTPGSGVTVPSASIRPCSGRLELMPRRFNNRGFRRAEVSLTRVSVESGEVDAAGPRHEFAAHGTLDGFQQGHEGGVRVTPPPEPSGGTTTGRVVAARSYRGTARMVAARSAIWVSVHAPRMPGAATR